MNKAGIVDLLQKNKCTMVMLKDYGDNKLHEITGGTTAQCINEFEEMVDNFADLRKIQVCAKSDKATPWSKGFTWQLIFAGDKGVAGAAGAVVPSSGISAHDYITMFTNMTDKLMGVQQKLFENQIAMKQDDPSKYIPLVQMLGPAFGLKLGGIQGPETAERTKELHFSDVETKDFTQEELSARLNQCILNIAKNVPDAKKIYAIFSQLEKNTKLSDQAYDIATLLKKNNESPDVLKTLMSLL